MRVLVLAGFLLCGVALRADPSASDLSDSPLTIVNEKVDVTVGRELTLVSGRFMFQYIEHDDPNLAAQLFVHFPLYAEKDMIDWQDIASAVDIKLEIGGLTLRPTAGVVVSPDLLSEFPIPADASVAFMTFAIPRQAAKMRFTATVSYVQPNFHYRGVLLAAYTPWQPRTMQLPRNFDFNRRDFEVSVTPATGVAFKRYTANNDVVKESSAELIAVPVHRQSIAVEILPEKTPKPAAPVTH